MPSKMDCIARRHTNHNSGLSAHRSANVKHISHDYPPGPYRAIGPVGQNHREKPDVLAFWPTLWPGGSALRPDMDTACACQSLPFLPSCRGMLAGTAARCKSLRHRGLGLARASPCHAVACSEMIRTTANPGQMWTTAATPLRPPNATGGVGSISREIVTFSRLGRAIWRDGVG